MEKSSFLELQSYWVCRRRIGELVLHLFKSEADDGTSWSFRCWQKTLQNTIPRFYDPPKVRFSLMGWSARFELNSCMAGCRQSGYFHFQHLFVMCLWSGNGRWLLFGRQLDSLMPWNLSNRGFDTQLGTEVAYLENVNGCDRACFAPRPEYLNPGWSNKCAGLCVWAVDSSH